MEGHTDVVTGVGISSDGSIGVSGSYDKTVRVWTLSQGKCKHTMQGHKDSVTGVALRPDGKVAVSGGLDRLVIVWNCDSGSKTYQFDGHSDVVYSVAIGGTRAASASRLVLRQHITLGYF